MGNISLKNILFSVLAKYRLIGRVWTSQFIQDHPLGLTSRTFALGWYGEAWVLFGTHHSFGLGEWDIGPISLSPSYVNKFFTIKLKKISIFSQQSIYLFIIFHAHE